MTPKTRRRTRYEPKCCWHYKESRPRWNVFTASRSSESPGSCPLFKVPGHADDGGFCKAIVLPGLRLAIAICKIAGWTDRNRLNFRNFLQNESLASILGRFGNSHKLNLVCL